MTARGLRVWLLVHRWTSLACTLNFLLLCATGLILVFHHEINDALGTLPAPAAGSTPLSAARVVEIAQTARPDRVPLVYSVDLDEPGRAFVSMGLPEDRDFSKAASVVVDRFGGRAFPEFELKKTFTGFMLFLHANLFLGMPGSLLVAAVGLCLMVSLVSGAVVYAPFMRRLAFATLRAGRGRRVFHVDLHNLVGIATLVWCLVVTVTGTVLALGTPIVKIYQVTDLVRMTAPFRDRPPPQRMVSLDEAQVAALNAWPGHRVNIAVFPGTALSGAHHYAFFMGRESGITSRVFKIAMVAAETGALTVASEAPWYIKLLLVSGPLHFGDYGGRGLQLVWALLGMTSLVLTLGGLYLWWTRRRAGAGSFDAIAEAHGLAPQTPPLVSGERT
jgi:uncharacterized iron-regulated membrane protein